jgi:hypothetical protein
MNEIVQTIKKQQNRLASHRLKKKGLGVEEGHASLTSLFRQHCEPYANHATKEEKKKYVRKKVKQQISSFTLNMVHKATATKKKN